MEWDGVKEEALFLLRKAAGWVCWRATALAVLGGEGPRAALGARFQRQSAVLQKTTVAALKAAAGALEVFTSAEALAAVAA